MARPCIRFATLVLGYLEETRMTPVEFSEYLRDWHDGGDSVNQILGGPETMAMVLAMVFTTRHQLKKELMNPKFNSMGFFLDYQLNRSLKDEMNPFADLFLDLPRETYNELAVASVDLTAMFVPQPSPWSQPAAFGPNKVELSHAPLPKRKPKPLPKPTHEAPSTLQ